MKIVILDGYTVNPGDLSWGPIQQLGELVVYDRTPAELVVQRAAEGEIVLTNKAVVSRSAIEQLACLRYIGVLATGYNIVDVEAARERGIPVTNVPTYATQSVAEAVFAHLLNLTHHTAEHAQGVRAGRWSACEDFCYWDWPLIDLAGLSLGIVGFGRIGQAVARIALAFQMQVLAYDSNPEVQKHLPAGVQWVELDELFAQSDVVSLHCPLTAQNERMVNARRLALMKPTAFLINTSRGGLIDEAALAEALNHGQIAGAGLDVLSIEPPPPDHPLLSARNCYITPHQAWATKAARQRLIQAAADNIRAFLTGKPQNVVNF
ncbi:MAG: D-2-hydroxyacid dehydrogenase [Thermoguttaceae bacterium]|nr:D-2-hydroxyacid dehydrogenase [Thermoguttaceae bacterium]MDW8038570.1 D-2-hydroxyacid dehydrogenase [Thermoguttaceae bacterium]